MTFTVSSSLLFSHLQVLSKVINSKNPLPILDDFLFIIEGGRLTVIASDQETTVRCSLDLVEADGDLTLALPARNLLDCFKEISGQPVRFDVNEDTLEVILYYQNGQFAFMADNGDEFPRMNDTGAPGHLALPASALLKGITSTLFASADDELRPVMNGVVMDITADDVTFVASDAHKLARLKYSSFKDENMEEGAHHLLILRKKPLNVLKTLLPKDDGSVDMFFDEKRIVFQYAEYTMASLLIEGVFPNFNAVIPKNHPYTIWIDRLSLLSALKRVSVCSDESNNLVKFEIDANALKITAQNPDFSTSAEETVVCQYDADPIAIGFKASFLVDILSNLSTSDVILKLADAARPGLVLPAENEEGEEILMLLMPMMIKA